MRVGARRGAIAAAAGALMTCGSSAVAAPQEPRASSPGLHEHFVSRVRSRNDGLPDVVARSVAQDRDGFLWIGTFDGLVRHDGTALRQFRLKDDPTLVEDAFVRLLFDREQRLWATGIASLRFRDDAGWHAIDLPTEFTMEPLPQPAAGPDGRIWIARGVHLAIVDATGRVERVAAPPGGGDGDAGWRMVVDGRGRVCAWNNGGAWRREEADWFPLLAAAPGHDALRGAAPSPRGGLWCVLGPRALRVVDATVVEERAVPPRLGSDWVELIEDREGALWAGAFNSGLAWIPAEGAACIASVVDGISTSHICALFEDADGVVHVGTGGGGLVSYTPRRVFAPSLDPITSRHRNVACLAEGADGALLAAIRGGSILEFADGGVRMVADAPTPFGRLEVTGLLRRTDGEVWFGTAQKGLWRVAGAESTAVLGMETTGRHVGALIERDGALWWSSTRGVLRWRDDAEAPEVVAFGGEDGGGGAVDLVAHEDGTLIAVGASGLARWDGAAFRPLILHLDRGFLAGDQFRTARSLPDGTLLVATDGVEPTLMVGLLRGATRTVSMQTLLRDVEVTDLLHVGDRIWANGDDAIRGFATSELMAFARGGSLPIALRLDTLDGLDTPLTSGPEPRRILADQDGRTWFASIAGLQYLRPAGLRPLQATPRIVLDRCVVDGKAMATAAGASHVRLAAGARHLRLGFSVPATRYAERTMLEYRLQGAAGWTPIGSDRWLDFAAPTPGTHRLELRACNGDGIRAADPTVIGIELEPRFWQTTLAQIALGSLGGLAAAALAWWRVRAHGRAASHRLAAAERLAQAHARADLLLSATDELVCFADDAGAITALNAAGSALLGARGMPQSRRRLEELVTDEARVEFVATALPAAREHGRWSGETRLRTADERTLPVMASLLVHRLPDGRIDFVSLVARDLSERLATERRRAELETQLRQAQKLEALGTLAGGVAHDFNNLLTAIRGHAELAAMLLAAGRSEAEAVDSVSEIVQASERGGEMIRRLLRFSRRGESRREVARLEPVVREACRLVRTTIPSGACFEVEIAAPDATACIDATEIHQVLVNLCTNAAHALRDGRGRIVVRLDTLTLREEEARAFVGLAAGPHLRLSVRDDGCGMTPEVLARMFEPFFTTKPTGKGSGLGLAVVHGIVTSHQGAIRVDSRPGAGTEVAILLPAVAPVVEAVDPESLAPEQVPMGEGRRILLVEDDAAVRSVGQRTLELLGYDVTATALPSEAIARVEASPGSFAAVVSDYSMPDWNGIQRARRLHAAAPGLPVVLVTACLNGARPDELIEFGIARMLEKPYERRALALALAEVVRARAVAPTEPVTA
jgi:signal transduction histidine kinase/CheY-like chemotaxis protein